MLVRGGFGWLQGWKLCIPYSVSYERVTVQSSDLCSLNSVHDAFSQTTREINKWLKSSSHGKEWQTIPLYSGLCLHLQYWGKTFSDKAANSSPNVCTHMGDHVISEKTPSSRASFRKGAEHPERQGSRVESWSLSSWWNLLSTTHSCLWGEGDLMKAPLGLRSSGNYHETQRKCSL